MGRLKPNQQNAIKWITAASVTNVLAAHRELCQITLGIKGCFSITEFELSKLKYYREALKAALYCVESLAGFLFPNLRDDIIIK